MSRPAPLEPKAVVQLVDDDADVRLALARLLSSAGVPVATFASAEEFLATAELANAACLVLDLRMPGASGLDLQAELASREVDLPILFLTGFGDVRSSVSAMKSGAVDFLQKPVDEGEFLAAVGRARERGGLLRARAREVTELRCRYESLTPRERQVLALVVAGRLNKQIAAELGAAEKTIKVHRARVMTKMGAPSLADLVRRAARLQTAGSDSGRFQPTSGPAE